MFHCVAFQLICFVVFFQKGARSEDVKNVTSYIGYIGEEIVLKAEVDPSWTLTRIRWSIYSNFTRIATFENNEINVNRWPPFEGRLEMSKSGDLTIKHLMANDSMEYTVFVKGQTEEKTSHVQLNVREQFNEPEITVMHNILDVNTCIIELKCKSLDHNIALKWEPEPSFKEPFCSCCANDTEELLMWTSFINRDVNFFCIATDHNRNRTSHVRVICPVPLPIIVWILLGIVIAFCIAIIYICKDQIKSASSRIVERH